MSSFWKEIERSIKNAEKMERIKEKERYYNAINKIENDTIKFNIELKETLSRIKNPISSYKFINNLNEFNEFVNEYYKEQKKDIIKRVYKKKNPISLSEYLKDKVPPQKYIKELFNSSLKQERIKQKNKYIQEYKDVYLKEFENDSIKDELEFNKKLEEENQKIVEYNNNLEERKRKFYSGDEFEVENILNEMFKLVGFQLDEKKYNVDKKFCYDFKKRSLNIDLYFFSPNVFTNILKSSKYIKKNNDFKYTYLSESEVNSYYESYLLSTTLFIVYSINYYFNNNIDYYFVNCFINDINPNSGKKDMILVLSSNIDSIKLNSININTIDAKEFFKSINSKISKNMKKLISVQQIPSNYQKNYEKYSIENINYNIDGFEFEKLSKDILLLNGFDQVEVTKASGDYGADVIAYKDEIKYAIQCKKFSAKVGVSAIQEVIASKSIYNCHVAVVLTNNYFTPNAIRLAKDNNVLLWDRDKLIMMLKEYKQKENNNV